MGKSRETLFGLSFQRVFNVNLSRAQYDTNFTDRDEKSNRKAMNRNWGDRKANPALKTKTGNKLILKIDKIQ